MLGYIHKNSLVHPTSSYDENYISSESFTVLSNLILSCKLRFRIFYWTVGSSMVQRFLFQSRCFYLYFITNVKHSLQPEKFFVRIGYLLIRNSCEYFKNIYSWNPKTTYCFKYMQEIKQKIKKKSSYEFIFQCFFGINSGRHILNNNMRLLECKNIGNEFFRGNNQLHSFNLLLIIFIVNNHYRQHMGNFNKKSIKCDRTSFSKKIWCSS